jgi:hypothetical protein
MRCKLRNSAITQRCRTSRKRVGPCTSLSVLLLRTCSTGQARADGSLAAATAPVQPVSKAPTAQARPARTRRPAGKRTPVVRGPAPTRSPLSRPQLQPPLRPTSVNSPTTSACGPPRSTASRAATHCQCRMIVGVAECAGPLRCSAQPNVARCEGGTYVHDNSTIITAQRFNSIPHHIPHR